jgi:hypothetical protein
VEKPNQQQQEWSEKPKDLAWREFLEFLERLKAMWRFNQSRRMMRQPKRRPWPVQYRPQPPGQRLSPRSRLPANVRDQREYPPKR